MNSIPEIRVEKRDGKIMCIQTFDADYFKRQKEDEKKLNIDNIILTRHKFGHLQIVGKFTNKINFDLDDGYGNFFPKSHCGGMKHLQIELMKQKIELFPHGFTILFLKDSDIINFPWKIGHLIKELTKPDLNISKLVNEKKSFWQWWKDDMRQAEKEFGLRK